MRPNPANDPLRRCSPFLASALPPRAKTSYRRELARALNAVRVFLQRLTSIHLAGRPGRGAQEICIRLNDGAIRTTRKLAPVGRPDRQTCPDSGSRSDPGAQIARPGRRRRGGCWRTGRRLRYHQTRPGRARDHRGRSSLRGRVGPMVQAVVEGRCRCWSWRGLASGRRRPMRARPPRSPRRCERSPEADRAAVARTLDGAGANAGASPGRSSKPPTTTSGRRSPSSSPTCRPATGRP